MKKTLVLSKYFGKTLLREKTIMILIISLPVLLVLAGSESAPDRDLSLILDEKTIHQVPAVEISVTLYTITAVVLIASMVSFFLGFNLKNILPRLKQMNYTTTEVTTGFVLVMFLINFIMTLVVAAFSLIWIDVNAYFGFLLGLILATVIFSTLGLIIAEFVDTTTLGLYSILTLAVLDTAFLENPLYSRRYNEDWISLMPSHESIQMVLRSVYDTGTHWSNNVIPIIIYEMVLIITYLLISKYQIGLANRMA